MKPRPRPEPRELSDEDVERQAEALAVYVAKGGSMWDWVDSKDFASGDRLAVLCKFAQIRPREFTKAKP